MVDNTYKNIKIPYIFGSDHEIYKFLENLIDWKKSFGYRTFHYFFEPGGLEVRIDSEHIEEFIDMIKSYLENNEDIKNRIIATGRSIENILTIDDYKAESNSYGDEADIAEKLFEYGSLAAIHIRTGKAKGELFRESKFIHCFLNQLGYDSLGEASFHNFSAQQMMLKHMREVEIPVYPMYGVYGVQKIDKRREEEMKGKDKDKDKRGPEFG